jgi:hypothetical protein
MMDLTGRSINGLRVLQLAGRNPFKWIVQCDKCKSETTELHTALSAGAVRCRNVACYLDRINPPKVSPHEQWLNAPEKQPETTPAPAPVSQPVPTKELPSIEYRRYREHALSHEWSQIISWEQWKTLPEQGRTFLLSGVEKEINNA